MGWQTSEDALHFEKLRKRFQYLKAGQAANRKMGVLLVSLKHQTFFLGAFSFPSSAKQSFLVNGGVSFSRYPNTLSREGVSFRFPPVRGSPPRIVSFESQDRGWLDEQSLSLEAKAA